MGNQEFDAENWIKRLAEALNELAHVQKDHREELDRHRSQGWRGIEFWNPSERYMSLYWNASRFESRHPERLYGPVRDAFMEVRGILAGHPGIEKLLVSSCSRDMGIRFVDHNAEWKPFALIGGLMARGLEAGDGGFRVACSELNQLLDPGSDCGPLGENLLTGCHVVLFQGLNVSEEIRVGDDLTIMPFGQVEEFIDYDMLENLVPGTARWRAGDLFAAIVKPFRWRPEIGKGGEMPEYDWSEIEPFFEDAEILIELLSLFHGAAVVRLASVPWRYHRRACLLLGEMGFHRSCRAETSPSPPGLIHSPIEAKRDAIDAAVRTLAARSGKHYRHCAPAIARLGEARARQGRFGIDDQILDVAIALERIYKPEGPGISAQLQRCVAELLGGDEEERTRMRNEVKHFYDVRSAIIHGPRDKKKRQLLEERLDAFHNGSELARKSVVKMLDEGPPQDWDEMPMEARKENPGVRQSDAKTTLPGYSNRNGQTVIRRTDTPGNDHNQVVYELECGDCGERYGANGSDIWQRKCPKCGGGRPGLSYS